VIKEEIRGILMTKARECAVNIIGKVLDKKAYSNIALSNELAKNSLNDKDKSLVTEIVYGTLRYKYTIDNILESFLKKGINSINPKILNILRITVYQIRYLDKVPEFAAVNEAVDMSKKISLGSSKLVNGVLRNYLRNKDNCNTNIMDEVEKLCFNYSFPRWMVELFIKQYGEENAVRIMKGLNSSPSVTVRVNNLKTNFDDSWNKLKENGYEIEEGIICPEAIRIIKGRSIENNPLFGEGLITVQDESAMLSSVCMDLKENMTILDLCSAPGGKATHISEIMNGTGKVKAFDIHKSKLSLIRQNAIRLGINNITCDIMDAAVLNNNLINSADRVLIDVPCSGLGIIRKKPEIKWTKNTKDIESIIETQKKIMNVACQYVKAGGILLYSTCTLNRKENNENITWFLENHPDYSLRTLFFGDINNILYESDGCMTILPNEYMDGFFIASLMRQR
jgi:16S rRNA (cytosine967-C5)-methyltransferase